ncbi:MAG TPA: glycosyltransferase, partial [Candidatus Saccharimonadales bacterium]|nr:glycosyltransferase [Candidatus Saccharimonadales bacterium]
MPLSPDPSTSPSGEPESRQPHLSIVIPIYNERENILPLWEELSPILRSLGSPFEVLFVDDGSRDGSAEILDRLRAKRPETRLLRGPRRSGQSAALLAGFRAA